MNVLQIAYEELQMMDCARGKVAMAITARCGMVALSMYAVFAVLFAPFSVNNLARTMWFFGFAGGVVACVWAIAACVLVANAQLSGRLWSERRVVLSHGRLMLESVHRRLDFPLTQCRWYSGNGSLISDGIGRRCSNGIILKHRGEAFLLGMGSEAFDSWKIVLEMFGVPRAVSDPAGITLFLWTIGGAVIGRALGVFVAIGRHGGVNPAFFRDAYVYGVFLGCVAALGCFTFPIIVASADGAAFGDAPRKRIE